jgi:hypothetical protein
MVSAMLCLTPLAVEQAVLWLDRLGRLSAPMAAATAALVALAITPHLLAFHVPWPMLAEAPQVDEAGFNVGPAEGAELAWTTAVRERTSADTVLVHPPLAAPVSVFSGRASYLATDGADVLRPGFSIAPSRSICRRRAAICGASGSAAAAARYMPTAPW